MLNGIGGRTIAEAQATLRYAEYLKWAEFRANRGSLFIGRRIEQAVGQLTYITAVASGAKNAKLDTFTPHEPRPNAPKGNSMAEFMRFAGV